MAVDNIVIPFTVRVAKRAVKIRGQVNLSSGHSPT